MEERGDLRSAKAVNVLEPKQVALLVVEGGEGGRHRFLEFLPITPLEVEQIGRRGRGNGVVLLLGGGWLAIASAQVDSRTQGCHPHPIGERAATRVFGDARRRSRLAH